MRFCTLAGARTVTCAATAHTDTLDIDTLCKDILFFSCLGAINGILALQGKIHIRIVLYVDTRLSVLCQVDFGMIQRQVNIGSLVFILTFQIHTNINAVAAGGQVGILDCQVNLCTLAHLDDGFIPCAPGIWECFSLGAGVHIHAVNDDIHVTVSILVRDIFFHSDSIVRCCTLCLLDDDLAIVFGILVHISTVFILIFALITKCSVLILRNSHITFFQLISHRRSTGANRAHCNRSGQRHCCQLEFLVCHFSSAPFQFMLT